MEENEEFVRRDEGPEVKKEYTGRENEEKHRLEEVDRIQVWCTEKVDTLNLSV